MSARATAKLGAACLLTAAAFDTAALYVPGAALLALALGAWAWVTLSARNASIEREPGPPTVVENEPYPLHVRVRDGLLPLRGEVRDPLLAAPHRVLTRFGRGERLMRGDARFARRGRHRLEPTRLAIFDPLRICTRELRAPRGAEVLVLPRLEPVEISASGGAPGGEAESGVGPGARGLTPDIEIDGIRPYRKGSPASRVHWPVFARHGELVERNLIGGAEGAPLVVVDATAPADGEALDRAVRAAASLCVHLARRGGCVLVAGRHGAIEIDQRLRSWPRAHVRLALLAAGEVPPPAARGADAAALFWVSAAVPGTGARPRGGPRNFLVTPFPSPAARPAFTVAGCAGIPLSARPARVEELAA